MKRTFTFDLFDSVSANKDSAGAKAACLSEISNHIPNIPPGFVISTSSFDQIILENGVACEIRKQLSRLDADDLERIRQTAAALQAIILGLQPPLHFISEVYSCFDMLGAQMVAVRSSAPYEDSHAHSWAGQFETFLGVNREALLTSVKSCWASLFSERALLYRAQSHIPADDFRLAVLVQSMVASEHSGVAFSLHPVRGATDVILVESVQGLGEALVSGRVTPSQYLIAKCNRRVISAKLEQQTETLLLGADATSWSLSRSGAKIAPVSSQLLDELAVRVLALESYFGWPVDVEWAAAGNTLFITQTRPVTVVPPSSESSTEHTGFDRYYGERRTVSSAEASIESYLRWRGYPANECSESFSFSDRGYLTNYFSRRDLPAAFEEGKKLADPPTFSEYLTRSRAVREKFSSLHEELRSEHLASASNATLRHFFCRYYENFQELYALYKTSQWEYTEYSVLRLKTLLAESAAVKAEIESRFVILTRLCIPDIVLREEMSALLLAKRPTVEIQAIEDFADKFPWLFFNTFDRKTCVRFVHDKIVALRAIPAERRRDRLREIEESLFHAHRDKEALLDEIDNPEVRYLSQMLSDLAYDRHELKACWAGIEFLFLDLFEEIGKRIGLTAETMLHSYRASDIVSFLSDGTKLSTESIERRLSAYALHLRDEKCHWYEGEEAQRLFNDLIAPCPLKEGEAEIEGTVANLGSARGKVRIIRVEGLESLMQDLKLFEPGEVLVTTMTQPTMMSLARRAAAIVTDEGGITSHAAIIARELDIPCVVGTKIATQLLQDGDLVEVDARGRGFVRRILPLSAELKPA